MEFLYTGSVQVDELQVIFVNLDIAISQYVRRYYPTIKPKPLLKILGGRFSLSGQRVEGDSKQNLN